jgi:hypothetical protein
MDVAPRVPLKMVGRVPPLASSAALSVVTANSERAKNAMTATRGPEMVAPINANLNPDSVVLLAAHVNLFVAMD